MNNKPTEIKIMRQRSNTRNIDAIDALTYMSASNYIKGLIKMNKKEEILEKINETKQNIKELEENIKELEEQLNKESKWPKEDDFYYYISLCRRSINKAFFEENSEYHIANVEIGNCFKNKKEAEFELEKLKVRAELKEFSFKPNWNDTNESKYSISYNNCSKRLHIDCISFIQDDIIYFESRDVAEKAIEQVGEYRIKKYIFGKE